MLGRAMLSALPEAAVDFRRPAEIVVGIAGLSIATGWVALFSESPQGRRSLPPARFAAAAFVCTTRVQHQRQGCYRTDLFVFAGICCVSVVCCWEAIQAVPSLRATERFPVWGDYNLQAIQIARFARLTAPPWAFPFFYHSPSLMLPAALNALAHEPALVCATALWTPLGFIGRRMATSPVVLLIRTRSFMAAPLSRASFGRRARASTSS